MEGRKMEEIRYGEMEMAMIAISPELDERGELKYRCEIYLATDEEGEYLHPLLRSEKEVLGEKLTKDWGAKSDDGFWLEKLTILKNQEEVDPLINEVVNLLKEVVRENREKLANAIDKLIKIYL